MTERVELTCPCGASMSTEAEFAATLNARINAWHEVHAEHERPVKGKPVPYRAIQELDKAYRGLRHQDDGRDLTDFSGGSLPSDWAIFSTPQPDNGSAQ